MRKATRFGVSAAIVLLTLLAMGGQMVMAPDPTPRELKESAIAELEAAKEEMIDKKDWKLKYVDSEDSLLGNWGAFAFDDDPQTIWHSKWCGGLTYCDPGSYGDPLPHEIEIDLGKLYLIKGFCYLPRQDGGTNGHIGDYEFYVSEDGINWVLVVAGTFTYSLGVKNVHFTATPGRYIRLVALTEASGNICFTAAAEICVKVKRMCLPEVVGKCKGIRLMTVSYTGGAGAAITVDKGIVTDNGDGTYTIIPEAGKEKLASNTLIYVGGVLGAKIHTSCSQPIDVGDVHGDFTITELDKMFDSKSGGGIDKVIGLIEASLDPSLWVDDDHLDPKNGKNVFENEKKATKELIELCGPIGKCKGIRLMTVSYTGGAGAAITVDKGIVTDNGDGTYTITPESGKDKLASNTLIYVGGVLGAKIHTSCSQPIDVGDVHGDFTITELDKIGGSSGALGPCCPTDIIGDVIEKLIEADRTLASVAIGEAELDPAADQGKLSKAKEHFDKAEEELGKGKYDKAIDGFKKAWEYALKAIGLK